MSPRRTAWSAIYDVHYGRGRDRKRGLKVVDLGHMAHHDDAAKAAERQEEASHGNVKAVLERSYAHATASIMSAVERLPLFT